MFSFNYLFEGEHVHSGSPIGRFVLLWKQQWRIPGWIVRNESRHKISRSLLIIGFSGDFKIFATILWTIDELPSSSQVSSDLEETPVRGSKVPTSICALLHTLLPSYGRKKTMILQWAVAAFVEACGSGRAAWKERLWPAEPVFSCLWFLLSLLSCNTNNHRIDHRLYVITAVSFQIISVSEWTLLLNPNF